jgi:hypothetical protein
VNLPPRVRPFPPRVRPPTGRAFHSPLDIPILSLTLPPSPSIRTAPPPALCTTPPHRLRVASFPSRSRPDLRPPRGPPISACLVDHRPCCHPRTNHGRHPLRLAGSRSTRPLLDRCLRRPVAPLRGSLSRRPATHYDRPCSTLFDGRSHRHPAEVIFPSPIFSICTLQ